MIILRNNGTEKASVVKYEDRFYVASFIGAGYYIDHYHAMTRKPYRTLAGVKRACKFYGYTIA